MVSRREVLKYIFIAIMLMLFSKLLEIGLNNRRPRPTESKLDNFLKEIFYGMKEKFNGILDSIDISKKVLSNVVDEFNANQVVIPYFTIKCKGPYAYVNIYTTNVNAQKYMALLNISRCLKYGNESEIDKYMDVLNGNIVQPIPIVLPRILNPDLNLDGDNVGNQFQYSIYIANKIISKFNVDISFYYVNNKLFIIIHNGDKAIVFPHPDTIFSCDTYEKAVEETMKMLKDTNNETKLGYLDKFYLSKDQIKIELIHNGVTEYIIKNTGIAPLVAYWEDQGNVLESINWSECEYYSSIFSNINEDKLLKYLNGRGVSITKDDIESWKSYFLDIVLNVFVNYNIVRLNKIVKILESIDNDVFNKTLINITQ